MASRSLRTVSKLIVPQDIGSRDSLALILFFGYKRPVQYKNKIIKMIALMPPMG